MRELGGMRTLSIALVISLMVNMLLVGLVGGQALANRTVQPELAGPPHRGERLARGILDDASREDRRRVGRALFMALRENREFVAQRMQARRALGEALAAEPYDETAVRAAFETMRQADIELQRALQETLADEFAGLTTKQRRALAGAIMEPPGEVRRLRPERLQPPPDNRP